MPAKRAATGLDEAREAANKKRLSIMEETFPVPGERKSSADPDAVPWYILVPDHPWVTACELMGMVALIAIFFVLPFEIAFVDSPMVPVWYDGLYLFNRLIDIIFILDLVTTFFVAVPRKPLDDAEESAAEASQEDEGEQQASLLKKTADLETRMSRIALLLLPLRPPKTLFSLPLLRPMTTFKFKIFK